VAWPGGYGLIKEILSVDGETVTRRFVHQDGPLPAAGTRVDLDRKAISPGGEYLAGAKVVAVPGPLGTYPSRYLPGWRDTWVLMVNGNSLDWRNLGALPGPLHDAGYPVLIVTLRNYPGAPEGSGGRLTYGVDEWADLDAAVQFALDAGARNVVLVAASMGAGVVMSFFTHSSQTAAVAAVFFDAPMLSLRRAVEFQASQFNLPLVRLGLPGTVTASARWIASLRYGVDWSATAYLDDGGRVTAPVLIVHGDDDEDVPLATSREFARRYPDTVRLVVVEGARHLEAWNVDPAAYETLLLQFLEANVD
jgi:alpha-beta hydrolase superfamily lysophospholipase